MSAMPDKSRDKPSSIVRVLRMIEACAHAERPLLATDLADQLDIPRPTAHRLVATLCREGFMQMDPRGRLIAAPRLESMATRLWYDARHKLERQAILHGLAERIGETCGIAAPDGLDMVYYDRAEANWPLRLNLPVGARVPMACTSGGKLYLASLCPAERARVLDNLTLRRYARNSIVDRAALEEDLDRIQITGLGIDDEEFIDGMVACAVAIETADGRLLASLFCHAPVVRESLESLLAFEHALRDAAGSLAVLLDDPPA